MTTQTTLPAETIIAGLDPEHTILVIAANLETKFRKMATAKRQAAAEKMFAVPATVEAPIVEVEATQDPMNDLEELNEDRHVEAAPVTINLIDGLLGQADPDPVMDILNRRILDQAAEIASLRAGNGSVQGLPDLRRRSHYEGDLEGVATHRSAASRHGEKVLYPPYQFGGEAHRTIAAVLAERGVEIGDSVTHAEMAWIPGRSSDQARFGSEASRRTAIHRLANGGFLDPVHAVGAKKASGYTVTPLMWAHLEG